MDATANRLAPEEDRAGRRGRTAFQARLSGQPRGSVEQQRHQEVQSGGGGEDAQVGRGALGEDGAFDQWSAPAMQSDRWGQRYYPDVRAGGCVALGKRPTGVRL